MCCCNCCRRCCRCCCRCCCCPRWCNSDGGNHWDPCADERRWAYREGFNDGYREGFEDGRWNRRPCPRSN